MSDALTVLTSASGEAEADMIREWLTEAGIHSLAQVSRRGVRLGSAAPREVYVYESDRERALAVLNSEVPSEQELQSLRRRARTQPTRPSLRAARRDSGALARRDRRDAQPCVHASPAGPGPGIRAELIRSIILWAVLWVTPSSRSICLAEMPPRVAPIR